jgi:Repeat of unknown function (DUF5650)
MTRSRHRALRRFAASVLAWALLIPTISRAAQKDIHGPAGSVHFGTFVTVLPNGNIVVVDPAGPSNFSAVYLYDPNGGLISTLTGDRANDGIGTGRIFVVGNQNFLVCSPDWHDGAGAATWVDGVHGLSGTVSQSNSLVGTTAQDFVCSAGVTVLTNGNYVVVSPHWNGGTSGNSFGAATWGDGNRGVSGAVSVDNSLIGSMKDDGIGFGGVIALSNGNYVVDSSDWNAYHDENLGSFGAVTWSDGKRGITGVVSPSNSLVGTMSGDQVGYPGDTALITGHRGVTALVNGNFVVDSMYWSNGIPSGNFGAVTWVNGASGLTGSVSTSNSLFGSSTEEEIGSEGVTALRNGNYVVDSAGWTNGLQDGEFGAVTWGNGTIGIVGAVSSVNSLVGTTQGDFVGGGGVTALSNGNYIVDSYQWNNGTRGKAVGAVTWGNGTSGLTGPVSLGNSLFGENAGEVIGKDGVTALSNGNYVVGSRYWSKGTSNSGAVTWGNGITGTIGTVSTMNSLVGATAASTNIFIDQLVALTNGNYIVSVPSDASGAATMWANGSNNMTGSLNSYPLIRGSSASDGIGAKVVALVNGNYVVVSFWSNGVTNGDFGAVTWGAGTSATTAIVSPSNSLVGTTAHDDVGYAVTALPDGNYVVRTWNWNNHGIPAAGAITLADGRFGLRGPIAPWNSVIGTAANGGIGMVFAYDAIRQRLAVGRPSDNIVSLFTMDQIFAAAFDP